MIRMLALDDDIDFGRSLVKWIGQNTNWEAEYALNTKDARSLLLREKFDALLLDRNLSDKSGIPDRWGDEFFRELRSDTRWDDLAVVFLTGYGTQQNAADMVRLGAFQYLTKPLPLEILLPTVSAAVAWQRSMRMCRQLVGDIRDEGTLLREMERTFQEVRADHEDYPLDLRSLEAGNLDRTGLSAVLDNNKRSVLFSSKQEMTEKGVTSRFADSESLLAAKVVGEAGKLSGVLSLESRQVKAFDPVWVSVIEGFADVIGLRRRLAELARRAVESEYEGLVAAAAEFRHAFNGRLQVIKSNTRRIDSADLSCLSSADREKVRESADTINDTVDRLAAYVKRMGSLSDVESARIEQVDATRLVWNCWSALKDRSDLEEIRWLAPAAPVAIQADAMLLEESVRCLLSNAIDAIAEDREARGGTGQSDAIEVKISKATPGDVLISVRDTGIGFEPGAEARLFKPFFTTKTDRPVQQAHEGIGLFTVRRVMHLHGGEVTARSPGYHQGATFMLRIPQRE